MEEANKIVKNIAWAVVILFLSILLAFVGMNLTIEKTNKAIGVLDGKVSGFTLLVNNIENGISDILTKLGVIDASTSGLKSVCAYKPTATVSSNPVKNCRPLTTKMGYGLVDCPTEGVTTYYCNGHVTTKEDASCCNPNVNTGVCN